MRTVVGYHRYDTAAELLPAQQDWALQSKLDQLLLPAAKARLEGPRRREVSRNTTVRPPRTARANHSTISANKAILADTHASINPAACNGASRPSPLSCSISATTKAAPKTGTNRRTLYARILR